MTKPTTKFVRHKFEDEHYRDLAICYQNLTDLCELFDKGRNFISSLIAVEIAKLVADEGRDQSPALLRIPRAKELLFSSTPERFSIPAGSEYAGKYNLLIHESVRVKKFDLGVVMMRSAVPRCWEFARNDLWPNWSCVSYQNWWNDTIVMSEAHTTGTPYRYTRRGLIKTVRDAQGAHSRGTIREDELPLNDPNSFNTAVSYSGPLEAGEEVRHTVDVLPSQAAVRQIGEELLHAINRNNRAGLFD